VNILRYRNEIIVAAALLFALGALGYKYTHREKVYDENLQMRQTLQQLQEATALKSRWSEKKTAQKLASLRQRFPASKVVWQKRGRKLNATFKELSAKEANMLITKLLNIAVQIVTLNVEKKQNNYTVEVVCKW